MKGLEKRAGDLVRGLHGSLSSGGMAVQPCRQNVLGRLPGSNDLRGALQMSGVQDTADMEP